MCVSPEAFNRLAAAVSAASLLFRKPTFVYSSASELLRGWDEAKTFTSCHSTQHEGVGSDKFSSVSAIVAHFSLAILDE